MPRLPFLKHRDLQLAVTSSEPGTEFRLELPAKSGASRANLGVSGHIHPEIKGQWFNYFCDFRGGEISFFDLSKKQGAFQLLEFQNSLTHKTEGILLHINFHVQIFMLSWVFFHCDTHHFRLPPLLVRGSRAIVSCRAPSAAEPPGACPG